MINDKIEYQTLSWNTYKSFQICPSIKAKSYSGAAQRNVLKFTTCNTLIYHLIEKECIHIKTDGICLFLTSHGHYSFQKVRKGTFIIFSPSYRFKKLKEYNIFNVDNELWERLCRAHDGFKVTYYGCIRAGSWCIQRTGDNLHSTQTVCFRILRKAVHILL